MPLRSIVTFTLLSLLLTYGLATGHPASNSPNPAQDPNPCSMINLGEDGPYDINERGQITGLISTPDGLHAFLWDQGKMTDLGKGRGFAINNQGDIVGTNAVIVGELRAMLWRNGQAIDLGTMGGIRCVARDINDRGQIVGLIIFSTNPVKNRGFVWQNGQIQTLTTLGGEASAALAINNRGQIVGTSTTANGESHAVLWQDGTIVDLGTLGGSESSAIDINERGQIVGNSRMPDGYSSHAFLWQHGSMTDLGILGNREHSVAVGINNRGQVVGFGFYQVLVPGGLPFQRPHAFIWQDGVMTDLGTFEGRSESLANHINDHGQIVGWSRDYSGNQRGIIWRDCSIQEPSSSFISKAGVPSDVAADQLRFDAVVANSSPHGVQFTYNVPATTGHLQIKVYDVAGRLIAEPFSGTQNQGTGSAYWDGTTSAGRFVPTGIYFAQMQMDGHSLVRRIMLAR